MPQLMITDHMAVSCSLSIISKIKQNYNLSAARTYTHPFLNHAWSLPDFQWNSFSSLTNVKCQFKNVCLIFSDNNTMHLMAA